MYEKDSTNRPVQVKKAAVAADEDEEGEAKEEKIVVVKDLNKSKNEGK